MAKGFCACKMTCLSSATLGSLKKINVLIKDGKLGRE